MRVRQAPPDLCGRGAATSLPAGLPVRPAARRSLIGPECPTCSRVRRRNSWDSSSGCSSSSASVQLRPPTSPAMVVARRPRPATHKAPRRKRRGSDIRGRDSGVIRRARTLPDAFCGGWSVGPAALVEAAQPGGWARIPSSGTAGPGGASSETRKAKPPERAAIGRASCDVPWQRPQGFSRLLGETESSESADNPDPDWHVLLFAFYDVSIADGLISLLRKVSPIWPGHRINSL